MNRSYTYELSWGLEPGRFLKETKFGDGRHFSFIMLLCGFRGLSDGVLYWNCGGRFGTQGRRCCIDSLRLFELFCARYGFHRFLVCRLLRRMLVLLFIDGIVVLLLLFGLVGVGFAVVGQAVSGSRLLVVVFRILLSNLHQGWQMLRFTVIFLPLLFLAILARDIAFA